jgi:hypothetical protein
MKLRLGMHLDGQHGRAPANLMGASDVGPLGLLGILETQLGLVPPPVSAAQRCVQYRECLQQLNGPERFFHKSYEADDFGTAATLLSWRDEWRIHGWSGDIGQEGSSRLRDMVAIEKLAQGLLSPGSAERLQSISDAMTGRRLLIESIALVDPLEVFPLLWQRVLTKLPIQPPVAPAVTGRGLLGKLQQAVINAEAKGSKEPMNWQDDGSLHVVQGETSLMSGRWIAEALHQAGPDTLFVATSEAATTDAFLAAADYPRQGLSESSAFRPALQLLPLLLELLWQPLNFNALIQFLTHPICPLSGKVRRRLAGVQSEYPGIGGPRWRETIAEIEAEAGERATQVRQAIAFWIEHPRFDPTTGVPVATVLERTQRLTDFFRNSPSDASPALRMAYAAGYNQSLSFAENLSRLLDQGVESLRPRQLEQLATQATARGNDNPLRVADVGALPCITHPGAVIVDHAVVLWGPLDAPTLPPPWPWSKAEIAALQSAGCTLPEPESLLQNVARDWLRPILAAKDKLILVLPPEDRETHPVWQMLKALVANLPIYPVESLLRAGSVPMTPITHTPLPGIKRWWQLPEGTAIPPVQEYSFSQLDKQVFNPFHWLLANAAKLRSGSLLSLADDFRLKGLLAHSLVERLYRDADGLTMSDDQFAAWFGPAFDQLIAEEGAVYLMPGRRTERDNLRQTLRRALLELRGIVRAANVSMVEPERKLSGHFVGGSLGGYSDLILMKPDKSHAIIDMKWAGKSHRTKLEENRHLQLAIYSELLRQSTGQWPALAYFLFSQGKLLTRDDLWFPGTHPVSNRSGENTAQLWQRFLVTWKWRQEQFAKGLFEVVLDDSDEAESMPPEDGLPIEILNADYNECLHLAGWGERA